MPRRPCLGIPQADAPPACPTQALAPEGKSRCLACERLTRKPHEARRPPRSKAQYKGGWPAQAKAAIAAHRAIHGDVCPGWQREPHPIHPSHWVCDHDVGPLCTSCNGTKAATADKQRAAERRTAAGE